MTVRPYEEKNLPAMIAIWSAVVEDGCAFPQEEPLTAESGRAFFASQTVSAVASAARGKHIGELLVKDCLFQAKKWWALSPPLGQFSVI